jgi:hypothetical protein
MLMADRFLSKCQRDSYSSFDDTRMDKFNSRSPTLLLASQVVNTVTLPTMMPGIETMADKQSETCYVSCHFFRSFCRENRVRWASWPTEIPGHREYLDLQHASNALFSGFLSVTSHPLKELANVHYPGFQFHCHLLSD